MSDKISVVCSYPRSLYNFRGNLIKKIVSYGFEIDCLGPKANSEEVEKVNDLGATYKPIPINRNGLNPIDDIKLFLFLCRYFLTSNSSKVLAYTIKPVIWTGIAMHFSRKIKFYALITGLGFAFEGRGAKRKLIKKIVIFLYRISLIKAEKVIFQNIDDLEQLVSLGIVDKSKCFLISGSGVDAEYYCNEPLPEIDSVNFIMVSRLLKEKGVRYYVEAAKLLKNKYDNVQCDLLGPIDNSLDSISLSEVNSWVEEGFINYFEETDDVRPFIKNSHVFVLPSFYGEGLPRTILEAMSMGRPILTTDNVGCRETVTDYDNGFLVPVRDAGELLKKMVWFVDNKDEIQLMGRRSRQMVIDKFEVNIINDKFLETLGIKDDKTNS